MPVEAMPRFHPAIKDDRWYVSDSHKGRGVIFIVGEAFDSYAKACEAARDMNKEQNAS